MSGLLHRAGDPTHPARLGVKGALLCDALSLGLPVPPFFVLTTEVFHAYRAKGAVPAALDAALDEGLGALEQATGRRLGDLRAPLVVSVRSSAPVSMPGALDTVLDVGAVPAVLEGLAVRLGGRTAALDVHRRALESWASVVLRIPHARGDEHAGVRVAARAAVPFSPPSESELSARIARLERLIAESGGIPGDPRAQVRAAVEAVLRSWDGERARDARRAQGVDEALGTAVIVQAMVFGNAAPPSGSGVAFTRSPVTGEAQLFGEWLPLAQGDEVVSGRASPAALRAAAAGRREGESLERQCPEAYAELAAIAAQLERRHRDALELEVTLERGKLWLLQVRVAKRAPRAAVRIAVDLAREGTIDRALALERIDPALLEAFVERSVAADLAETPLTVGVPASAGAAAGRVVFDSGDAMAAGAEPVVLVRPECSPEDTPGIRAAAGVLTASGGVTSHAAVIARALGKPCIVAAGELRIDLAAGRAEVRRAGGVVCALPRVITIDGGSGCVFAGALPIVSRFAAPEARELLAWARELGGHPAWKDFLARFPI
jgi:pyruvate,orthophosphate dikinase